MRILIMCGVFNAFSIIRGNRRGGDLREFGFDRRARPLRRLHFRRTMPMLVGFDERVAALHRIRVIVIGGHRGLIMDDEATALAGGAFLGERFDKPLADTLAGHLPASPYRRNRS